MIYNLTPGEQRVMRKTLMRSVKVVSEGKLMTELPSYSAERLAENHPTRTDASILSGPYTPTYIAAAEIERLKGALSEGMEMRRWIPASERMPDVGAHVLLWSMRERLTEDAEGDVIQTDVGEVSMGECRDGSMGPYLDDWSASNHDYVTHWMPLPEAPK